MDRMEYTAMRRIKVRSRFENRIVEQLLKDKVDFAYEPFSLTYTQPEKPRRYTPDIVLKNGVIVELKGRFTAHDRAKHLCLKAQGHTVRLVFMRASEKIRKGSSTSYGEWCTKHGIIWADGSIPKAWIHEKKGT